MTENKRFELERVGLSYFLKDNGKDLTAREVFVLLNELDKENQLLKKALREELEVHGSSYHIDLFEKIFNLGYDEWQNKMYENQEYDYVDWESMIDD